jgi:hypothetical protein
MFLRKVTSYKTHIQETTFFSAKSSSQCVTFTSIYHCYNEDRRRVYLAIGTSVACKPLAPDSTAPRHMFRYFIYATSVHTAN